MNRVIIHELKAVADEKRAVIVSRFFKTGKGEYGEGDVFLGVTTPQERKIAKKHYKNASFKDVQMLLENRYHECRLTALFILVYKYEKADEAERKRIYTFYMKNLRYVNNWDLVDTTTPHIVGAYLYEHPEKKDILYILARSKNLWRRRVSILATQAFIRKGEYEDALKIAQILLYDKHDLIHKAVGWMLREVGKKDQKKEEAFLDQCYTTMPRTMLRYAIERLPEKKRKHYMKK